MIIMVIKQASILLTGLLLFTSLHSQAVTINLTIIGDKVNYENAKPFSSVTKGYALTSSEIYNNLQPTKKWITALNKVKQNISLSGPESGAKLSFDLIGLEYDLASDKFTNVSNNSMLGLESRQCSAEQPISGGTRVFDTSSGEVRCIGHYVHTSSVGYTPFFFVRPVFKIDENALMEELKGKASGTYYANINVPFRYYFYTDNDVFTYRNLHLPISFQVHFTPGYLQSVSVTSPTNGIILPNYENGVVKGEAKYIVKAQGYFNSGLKMRFDTLKSYQLTHDSDSTSTIPYYVKCQTCNRQDIISDGVMTPAVSGDGGVVVKLINGDNAQLNYELLVGYDERTIDQVKTGNYRDSFTVLFALDF